MTCLQRCGEPKIPRDKVFYSQYFEVELREDAKVGSEIADLGLVPHACGLFHFSRLDEKKLYHLNME